MKRVRLTAEAEDDLIAAVAFYEYQEPGAGDVLFEGILSCLKKLRKLHGFHRMVLGFHKMLAEKFPHAIYYAVGEEVVVVAIIDLRRDPGIIAEEMSKRRAE